MAPLGGTVALEAVVMLLIEDPMARQVLHSALPVLQTVLADPLEGPRDELVPAEGLALAYQAAFADPAIATAEVASDVVQVRVLPVLIRRGSVEALAHQREAQVVHHSPCRVLRLVAQQGVDPRQDLVLQVQDPQCGHCLLSAHGWVCLSGML